jgi:hypothetical protein
MCYIFVYQYFIVSIGFRLIWRLKVNHLLEKFHDMYLD